jgi:hypothetical protein
VNTYGGVEVWLHVFLTSALDDGEWSASRTGHINPKEGVPGTHWIRDWVGPRAGLDTAVAKWKIPRPCQESNVGRPSRSLIAILTELRRICLWQVRPYKSSYCSFPHRFQEQHFNHIKTKQIFKQRICRHILSSVSAFNTFRSLQVYLHWFS